MQLAAFSTGFDEILDCCCGRLEFRVAKKRMNGLEISSSGFLESRDWQLWEGVLESKHLPFGCIFLIAWTLLALVDAFKNTTHQLEELSCCFARLEVPLLMSGTNKYIFQGILTSSPLTLIFELKPRLSTWDCVRPFENNFNITADESVRSTRRWSS